MYKYHKELNLSAQPLAKNGLEYIHDGKYNSYIYAGYLQNKSLNAQGAFGFSETEKILSTELLDIFANLKLKPAVVINFGIKNHTAWQCPVHRDIAITGPEKFHFWPASLNFEVTDADFVTWYFYDTSSVDSSNETPAQTMTDEEIKQKYPQNLILGNRIKNSSVFNQEEIDNLGFKVIETYNAKKQTYYLNCVNTPHSIAWKITSAPTRISIGIKFDLETLPSWDKALEVFDPFIIK